jgi:uncharacterized protein (DUF1684 family)
MTKYSMIKELAVIFVLATAGIEASAQVGNPDTTGLAAIRKFYAERDAEFRDPAQSPLPPADQKKYTGLCYFDIDLSYRVKATFITTASPTLFRMQTTGTRRPEYVKYGEVRFELQGQTYTLGVYQSQDLKKVSGYEDYLFIPFTDMTSGQETYAVGRYMDFRIPKEQTGEVIIDFNRSYYPSCAYGKSGYSCPIPPQENALPVSIRAGERNCSGAPHGKKH